MSPIGIPRRPNIDQSLFTYAGLILMCPLVLQSCTPERAMVRLASRQHHSELASKNHHKHRSGSYLSCGEGVSLCGILALESGLGSGAYEHQHPHVHGLWPSTGEYGNSQCVSPSTSSQAPHHLYSCYHQHAESESHLLNFQQGEWEKHGTCAGVSDAADYFNQVCTLSTDPLSIMETAKSSGGGLDSMADALKEAGYPVQDVEPTTGQIYLSACATGGVFGSGYFWQVAEASAFPQKCGNSISVEALPPAVPGLQMCVANQHGPKCSQDQECAGVPGCLRCANSGFCTNVALPSFLAKERRN